MKRLKTLLFLLISAEIGLNVSAQKKQTLYVPKAGTLVELITQEEANQITHLTLQGKLNAIDFRHLRDEFENLSVLDLSGASISSYAGKKGTYPNRFYVYPSNCIPAYAFCKKVNDSTYMGKHTLKHIILSDKTKNIEDAAFKNCHRLKICHIRKNTPPNLMSEALADNITAIFVPVGCSDAYRNEKNWSSFSIAEGEPVVKFMQISKMESLASVLLRQGVQPKDVHFLRVEGKLDEADFKLIRDYMPNLVSIDLARTNVTAIPDYTFTQKKFLLNVVLPAKLRSIGQRAFSGCLRLSGILKLPLP